MKKIKHTAVGDYAGRQYNGNRPDNRGRYQSDNQNWNREKPVLQNERSHPGSDVIAEKKQKHSGNK